MKLSAEQLLVINRIEELRKLMNKARIENNSNFITTIDFSLKANYNILGMTEKEYDKWLEEISKE